MATPRPLPATFGRFQVDGLIGEGGMGAVYRAVDPILQRIVAIKTIRNEFEDASLLERFRREAQACAGLQHPNIVTVYEAGAVDDTVFIVMECLKGANLAQTLHEGRLSFEQKIAVLLRVLDALDFAHRAGIIHRDVKPANIHVLPDLSVKLLDFGLARSIETGTLTQSNAVVGTPFYASPEQLSGERVDARTDVYSLGVVAYEMFANRRAFDGDSIGAIVAKVLVAPPAPIDTTWTRAFPEIERIVARAMAKSAADRYESAAAMRADLDAFLDSSRSAIAARQRELDSEVRRIADESTLLMKDGRVDEARTLLSAALEANPEAAEIRNLLDSTAVRPPQFVDSVAAPASPTPPPAPVSAVAPRRSRRALVFGTVAATLLAAAVARPILMRSGTTPPTTMEPPLSAAPERTKPATSEHPRKADSHPPAAADGTPQSTIPGTQTKTDGADAKTVSFDRKPADTASRTKPRPGPTPTAPTYTAKQLFYGSIAGAGSSTSTAPAGTGLRYRLLSQLESGTEAEVAPTTTFKSGDRVRFAFESNVDGYLYVVEEGSTGHWLVLFPNPEINGGANFVHRLQPYAVPATKWFVFDEHPGTERLFVLLSKEPMRELPGLNQTVTHYATVEPAIVQRLSRELQSRDLILQTDTAPQRDSSGGPSAPAAYVVNRDQLAKEVATTIELVHK